MQSHFIIHYIAAFSIVLLGTGLLAWMGVFESPTEITAFVPVEVPAANVTNTTNATVSQPKPAPNTPGAW